MLGSPPTLPCTLPHLSHLSFITTLPVLHCSLCSAHSSLQLSPSIPAILPMLLLLCMTQFSLSTVFSLCVSGLPLHSACLHSHQTLQNIPVSLKERFFNQIIIIIKKNLSTVYEQYHMYRLTLITGRNLVDPPQEQQWILYRIKQFTQWGTEISVLDLSSTAHKHTKNL